VLRTGTLAIAAVLVMVGCTAAPAGSAKTDVAVAVTDTSISAVPATAPAGEVTLKITNNGGTLHEVEVFTLPDGVDAATIPVESLIAQTESVGMEVIDEVEGIVPNGTPSLKVNLAAGRYALICNLPGHYALGMHTTLTVQ
jgi:uncharacterized cupredoxin-like copper-binding protein